MLTAETLAQRTVRRLARQRTTGAGKLDLPTPYPLEQEIIDHPAKRKVVACGRRVGKTCVAAMLAIGGEQYGKCGLFDGKRVLYVGTSADQTDPFWEYLTRWLAPLGNAVYKNETKRLLKYGSGIIRAKTGRNPDVLRGGGWDMLLLDEVAYLDPAAWYEVGAPMLADTGGAAYFFSSPARLNWFFQLYNESLNKELWARWNF